jgi:hypothetical protein
LRRILRGVVKTLHLLSHPSDLIKRKKIKDLPLYSLADKYLLHYLSTTFSPIRFL